MSKIFNRTAFFWLVNIVFMVISAYHAAPFFGSVVSTTPGLEQFAPYIGLPVALILDGITIVFMQARLEAVYRRDNRKAKEYLWYVFMASGMSTIANLYTDIEHFEMASYTHLWPLMQGLAPVVLSIFPLFLVAISKAADELVSGTSLDKLDVEEFEMQENRRLKLLEIQSISMQREALVVQQIINAEVMQKRNELTRKRIESGKIRVTEIATSTHFQPALQEARSSMKAEMKAEMETEMIDPSDGGGNGNETTTIDEMEEEMSAVILDTSNGNETTSSKIVPFPQCRKPSRKSMTVAEAANFLGCTDRQIRNLRSQGTLHVDDEGKITPASVRAYKKKRSTRPEGA